MKTKFKIETRFGWVSLPERIAGYDFPLSTNSSCQNATEFYTRERAEKAIKKYHLRQAPFFAHLQEFDVDNCAVF